MNSKSLIIRLLQIGAGLIIGSASPLASAENYPSKPIKAIVPFAPGSTTDQIGRAFAAKMSESLGQPVVVENRPGANGLIGADFVAKAPADGYTILFGTNSTNAALKSLVKNLPYNQDTAFTPIGFFGSAPLIIAINNDVPAKSLNGFVSLAKANPGKLNFASVGSGSLGHLGAELFNSLAGTSIAHVPYKGSPQAMTALISGEANMYLVASASSALPLIQSQQIKALGVSTKDRLPILPNVPAMSDSVKGYDVQGWNGILAPAGTPPELIDRLNKAIVKSVASPEFSKKLRQEGATGFSSTPAEFQHLIARDIAKWAKVIKEANIQLD